MLGMGYLMRRLLPAVVVVMVGVGMGQAVTAEETMTMAEEGGEVIKVEEDGTDKEEVMDEVIIDRDTDRCR